MKPIKKTDSIDTLMPALRETDFYPILQRSISGVRDELLDCPYIQEALRVLPVGGYRSAIGSFWNAVIDDLRNKIIHRSLSTFNREIKFRREIKTYDDFQDCVTDDDLIEGAYKIGVIGWEARKMLLQAKQIRHVFSGHPNSSDPSILKVLAMMEDCIKYVLSQEYPLQIIDIDDYMTALGNEGFDRNEQAVENALGDLPETYKDQLVHRLLTAYVHPDSASELRGNIEFIAPIFWKVIHKNTKITIVRRIDSIYPKSNKNETDKAFDFVRIVGGTRYLSVNARKYKLKPIIERLKENLDKWVIENECVKELRPYAGYIPPDLIEDYVWSLTHTYIGYIGSSFQFSRTDFYANGAAPTIILMFSKFDDELASAFVNCIKMSPILHVRISNPAKFRRLRSLAHIVLERISENFEDTEFLEILTDEKQEEKFFKILNAEKTTPKLIIKKKS